MKRSWIKLWLEILDDPKMGRMPDYLWRRAIELFLLAGENGNDGLLQPVTDMAWRLRVSEADLVKSLRTLSQIGVVHETPEGWVVSHFHDRQYSESYERVKRYRERYSNGESNADVAENESSSSSESVSGSVSEGVRGVGEGGEPAPGFPGTPREAVGHPDIRLFEQVCGRIPGQRDYAMVIDTVRFLREKHGPALAEFLTPYWLAWSSRKTRQGEAYRADSLVWLCEWAVNGEIPRANGHEPKLSAGKSAQEIIRKVAKDGAVASRTHR